MLPSIFTRRTKYPFRKEDVKAFYPKRDDVNSILQKIRTIPAPEKSPLSKNGELIYYITGGSNLMASTAYDQLQITIGKSGHKLVYMPLVLESVTPKKLRFNFPSGIAPTDVNLETFYRSAAASLGLPLNESSRYLIRYCQDSDCYEVCDISASSYREFITRAIAYATNHLPVLEEVSGTVLFSKSTCIFKDDEEDKCLYQMSDDGPSVFLKRYSTLVPLNADERFELDQVQLVAEAKSLIQRLILDNVSRDVIKSWLYEDIIISRLKVTKHYKIILPDYHDMEIKLTPLEKTVYLFFLRHEEGCMFKELPEHKEEIWKIYRKMSKSGDPIEILKSIDALVDPFGTSIIEKCARIKAKFISKMPEEIAQNYFIAGEQGKAKSISLPREKVEWDIDLKTDTENTDSSYKV